MLVEDDFLKYWVENENTEKLFSVSNNGYKDTSAMTVATLDLRFAP